jgi:hypothetical protein
METLKGDSQFMMQHVVGMSSCFKVEYRLKSSVSGKEAAGYGLGSCATIEPYKQLQYQNKSKIQIDPIIGVQYGIYIRRFS